MDFDIVKLKKKINKSGFLVEFLNGNELDKSNKQFNQIYVATILPGEFRGNHYHKKKFEWFTIFNGRIKVILEDIKTKERKEFILDSSQEYLSRIFLNSGIAHVFKNISESTVVLVAYTNKIYDPKKPDTYDYKVI
jgi:dTDP-4-dehydrorhamnose 3,5-epimerase-like enzyme